MANRFKKEDPVFCSNCGKEISSEANYCQFCGHKIKQYQIQIMDASPGQIAATILCFCLGGIGVHRFYVGKVGTGILMICTIGGLGIWWLIDFINEYDKSLYDKEGRLVAGGSKGIGRLKFLRLRIYIYIQKNIKHTLEDSSFFVFYEVHYKIPEIIYIIFIRIRIHIGPVILPIILFFFENHHFYENRNQSGRLASAMKVIIPFD